MIFVYISACSNEEYEVRFDTVGVPYCGVPFFVAGLKILQCQSTGRPTTKKKEIKIEVSSMKIFYTLIMDTMTMFVKIASFKMN